MSRGYCGIGIYNVKNGVNVGGLWRHAHAFGAAFVFVVGRRYRKEASDTTKAYRHLPMWQYEDAEDFLAHRPMDCQLVGVEIDISTTLTGTAKVMDVPRRYGRTQGGGEVKSSTIQVRVPVAIERDGEGV